MQNIDGEPDLQPTFHFKHVGPISDAQLQLGDLTVIAGRNNTGKTYLAYTLYGFLKFLPSLLDASILELERTRRPSNLFPDFYDITKKLVQDGRVHLPADKKLLLKQKKKLVSAASQAFSKQALSNVFNSNTVDFREASLNVLDNRPIPDLYGKRFCGAGVDLSIQLESEEIVIAVDEEEKKVYPKDIHRFVCGSYLRFLMCHEFPEPFILSAERFGISLFYKELDFTKNQLVDWLQKLGNEEKRDRFKPYLLIDRATSRYALPIKDNIHYTRGVPDMKRDQSEIFDGKLYDDIKEMMGGYYRSSEDDMRFVSKARKQGKFNIPLHLASSSARGLSDLYFFLRHVANRNHLVIIDEPESHLDTQNQRLLARLLTHMVRAGLKILITTHSDYLIKEINNLVMLNGSFAGKEEVCKGHGYRANDFLPPESIHAYVAENTQLISCTVDEFGIEMPVFDETIDQINKTSNELTSRILEDLELQSVG